MLPLAIRGRHELAGSWITRSELMRAKRTIVSLVLCGLAGLPVIAQDWPMWGGTAGRNMTSAMKGLPESWDAKNGTNIRWKTQLGSTSNGNPVVAGGKIFLGTNNANPRNPEITGDKGVLMCLRESDGTFLWQAVTDKLEAGGDSDWPEEGVCSSPAVDGQRLYYVNNRGELIGLDTEGFMDGENDGPFQDEIYRGPTDADILWKLDMRKELGVSQLFMASSSPVVWEDLIFVGTSNGRDVNDEKVPAPQAPSFVAVNKNTGKVVWQDSSPGEGILHGQWSSPGLGLVNGVQQVFFAGGDGWLYGFNARTGERLWRFDLNPKDAVWPKTRNYGVSTPVFSGGRVFMSVGQDPDHPNGVGHAYAINPGQRGDITESGRVWQYDKIKRSMSTAAVADGLVYVADLNGILHCLDAATGKPQWTFDMMAPVWGSPLVADGKVYLGDQDGDVAVVKAGSELKTLAEIDMGNSVYSTPVPANGVLYIMTRSALYAVAQRPTRAIDR
jgi:outer membrane protein assembly factor BamB